MNGETTLGSALADYRSWRMGAGGASPATIRGEAPGLGQFAMFCGQQLVMAHLTDDLVEKWWDSEQVRGLAQTTRATRLSQVRRFLGYCQQRQWLPYDPTALINCKLPAVEPRQHLGAGQLLALLDSAMLPRDRAIIAVGINLALRGGEIARLTVGDLNLAAGTLLVRIDKTNEIDIMPVSADLDVELRVWLRSYMQACGHVAKEAYLFPAQHYTPATGKVRYTPTRKLGEPWTVVQRALTACSLPSDKEGLHTLRRSVATLYFDMVKAEETFDGALLATMTLLHHTRPETTLRYIGRHQERDTRDVRLRGQRFLTKMVSEDTRTVPFRRVVG